MFEVWTSHQLSNSQVSYTDSRNGYYFWQTKASELEIQGKMFLFKSRIILNSEHGAARR